MKKLLFILMLPFLFFFACKKDTPAPADYRDKWVGKYFCNVTVETFYASGSLSSAGRFAYSKDTILVAKAWANDSAVAVCGDSEADISSLGVNQWDGQSIKFYSNDSIYIYLLDSGLGNSLGIANIETYKGKKIN